MIATLRIGTTYTILTDGGLSDGAIGLTNRGKLEAAGSLSRENAGRDTDDEEEDEETERGQHIEAIDH